MATNCIVNTSYFDMTFFRLDEKNSLDFYGEHSADSRPDYISVQ
jgi:hypothetical protein